MASKEISSKEVASYAARFKKQAGMWVFLIPTAVMLVVLQWLPLFRGLYMSFFSTRGFETINFVGLANYKRVLSDTMFIATLKNTVSYVLWSLIVGFPPSIILAILLNEVVHFNTGFKVLTYIPHVAPVLATSLIWKNMYSPRAGGLLNAVLSGIGLPTSAWLENPNLTILLIIVSSTWSGMAGGSLVYIASLKAIGQDLYEAAAIDGAGIWRRFFKITLPQMASIYLLMLVKQVIGIFQIMEQPLVMTGGGPNNASTSLNLTIYRYAFEYMRMDNALALAMVTFVILLVVSAFYFKVEKKLSR